MWPFNRSENRASSYSDALIQQILSSSGGSVGPQPISTGALEFCAGLVGRAFASASVEGPPMLTTALTPSFLNQVGRELVRHGEILFHVDFLDALKLSPVSAWDVQGGYDAEAWRYRLTLAGPSSVTTVGNRPAAGVLHFMYAHEAGRPHRGLSPVAAAHIAGRLSAEVAKALADEASGPRGSVLPLPGKDGSDPTVAALKNDLLKLNGQLALVESMRSGFVGASNAREAPADWQAKRIGAAPPVSLVSLHELASREIALACGVPAALVASSPTGTGTREAWRQFLFGTIAPIGRLVSEELSRKLGAPITLKWDELRASDLAGRARAFQSLVGGGMDLAKAAALAGLLDPSD